MQRIILAMCSLLFFSQAAMAAKNAGLFVEPLVSYELGEGKINYPSPISSSDTDLNGFGLGGRLGVHFKESFFLGFDGRYSMPQFKDSGLDIKTDAKAWNYGPVAGIQLPWVVGLRVWGGYIMDGEMNPDKDNNIDLKFQDGTGYRVGAGIKLAMVSLNLEYQDMTYGKTKVEEVGVFTPGSSFGNVELDNKTWLLSVSFPLSL